MKIMLPTPILWISLYILSQIIEYILLLESHSRASNVTTTYSTVRKEKLILYDHFHRNPIQIL